MQSNTSYDNSVITLSGKLTAAHGRDLRNQLGNAYDSDPKRIILDVKDLDFVDSTGLGIMASFLQKMRTNDGVMVLLNPKPEFKSLLELTRLDQFFVIKDTTA